MRKEWRSFITPSWIQQISNKLIGELEAAKKTNSDISTQFVKREKDYKVNKEALQTQIQELKNELFSSTQKFKEIEDEFEGKLEQIMADVSLRANK